MPVEEAVHRARVGLADTGRHQRFALEALHGADPDPRAVARHRAAVTCVTIHGEQGGLQIGLRDSRGAIEHVVLLVATFDALAARQEEREPRRPARAGEEGILALLVEIELAAYRRAEDHRLRVVRVELVRGRTARLPGQIDRPSGPGQIGEPEPHHSGGAAIALGAERALEAVVARLLHPIHETGARPVRFTVQAQILTFWNTPRRARRSRPFSGQRRLESASGDAAERALGEAWLGGAHAFEAHAADGHRRTERTAQPDARAGIAPGELSHRELRVRMPGGRRALHGAAQRLSQPRAATPTRPRRCQARAPTPANPPGSMCPPPAQRSAAGAPPRPAA